MITITRSLARQLRAVFRRAGAPRIGFKAMVAFLASADGLRVRFKTPTTATEYRLAGEFPAEQLSVSAEFLADCEGRMDEPVTIQAQASGRALVSWADRGVPQMAQYDIDSSSQAWDFPALPERMESVEPGLWSALADATQLADYNSTRYALNNLQLRGAGGQIEATDGHHALVQSGYRFPWQEALLIPASAIFNCPQLAPDGTLRLGKNEDWVALGSGPWAVFLKIDKQGRFPVLADLFRPVDGASSRFELAPADCSYLCDALPRLPGAEDSHRPITLDGDDGRLAIRAANADQSSVAELVLSNSRCSGEPIQTSVNRKFLLHAVKLGFASLYCFGPTAPMQAEDSRRKYLWAVLTPDGVVKPTANQISIASPLANQNAATISLPNTRQRSTMPKKRTPSDRSATQTVSPTPAANRPVATGQSPGPIEQAQALRETLREALTRTNELISALKRQRRQSKLVETTLSALEVLRSAG